MSTGEAFYLALIIASFLAFLATLAWVSRRGEAKPRSLKPARHHGPGHHSASAH